MRGLSVGYEGGLIVAVQLLRVVIVKRLGFPGNIGSRLEFVFLGLRFSEIGDG